MDLNELLHAHQVAVMKASASGDISPRDDHFTKVAEYAERIRQLRELRRTIHVPLEQATAIEPETIIYASYAGDPHTADLPVNSRSADSWESEGGALNPPEIPNMPEMTHLEVSPMGDPLPDGVTMKLVPQYFVGPYVYQDLGLAVAEHLRQLSAPTDDRPA